MVQYLSWKAWKWWRNEEFQTHPSDDDELTFIEHQKQQERNFMRNFIANKFPNGAFPTSNREKLLPFLHIRFFFDAFYSFQVLENLYFPVITKKRKKNRNGISKKVLNLKSWARIAIAWKNEENWVNPALFSCVRWVDKN